MAFDLFVPFVVQKRLDLPEHLEAIPLEHQMMRPFPDDASTWPSGSLFSSVDELARLGAALADSGRVDGRQLVDPRAVALLTSPQVGVAGPGSEACGHTLGLSHDGSTTSSYDSGQGSWAPIMGKPDNLRISQWI